MEEIIQICFKCFFLKRKKSVLHHTNVHTSVYMVFVALYKMHIVRVLPIHLSHCVPLLATSQLCYVCITNRSCLVLSGLQ